MPIIEDKKIDIHYIISRIINRYIGELNDDIEYERELRNLLDNLRDEMWESCGDSRGLCDEETVIELINTSLKSGFELIITKYSAVKEAKTRIIDVVREIVNSINEHTRESVGRDIIETSWITTPSTYRVKITINRDIDPEARLEIINDAGIKIILKPENREVKTELAKGTYIARLVSRGMIYAQKRFEVYRDLELNIVPKDIEKTQEGKGRIRRRYRRKTPIKPDLGYTLNSIIIGFRDPATRIIYIAILLLIVSALIQILSRIL